MPIFKAKNVDSNTSQFSRLEEEKARDFETNLSDETGQNDFKSLFQNVETRQRPVNRILDSEGDIDELVSQANDHTYGQIDSRGDMFTNGIKDKLSRFRLQYLQEPDKNDELDKLNTFYTKNEYNCQRKHHHNPKTFEKIQTLLGADFNDISSKNTIEEQIMPRKH